jgi:hypothetical protein
MGGQVLTSEGKTCSLRTSFTSSDQANVGSAIKAQADGAALDGDFNGKPGGDFVLPFEVFVTNA